MSRTQALLERIAALRQQLTDECKTIGSDGAVETSPLTSHQDGSQTAGLTPRRLTHAAQRLLYRGRDLLEQVRHLEAGATRENSDQSVRTSYQRLVSITEVALRLLQGLPDSPDEQLRICLGIAAIFDYANERCELLKARLERRQHSQRQLMQLSDILSRLHGGQDVSIASLISLAEELIDETGRGLRYQVSELMPAEPFCLATRIAQHQLRVARIMAQLVWDDPQLRSQPLEPVLVALIHDAGMLTVPEAVYLQSGPLDEEARRIVERHVFASEDYAARLLPDAEWPAQAVLCHHERLDGSGYPAGLRGEGIPPLARLLAVCDVYAAFGADRPHRTACDPRAALTDTLLLAEQGALDRQQAERLLRFAFYPVGTVVELSDGSIGIVVANHHQRRERSSPSRPVVALVRDGEGRFLPAPHHLDLAEVDQYSVVRTLRTAERNSVLGDRELEWQ